MPAAWVSDEQMRLPLPRSNTHIYCCSPHAADFSDPWTQALLNCRPNVFFLRTSNETELGEIELCSVRGAAEKNPGRSIFIFSNTLDCTSLTSSSSSSSDDAGRFPNLIVVRYDVKDVFEDYPHLLSWYDSRVWDMKYRGAHVADGLRLALLHKYGGVYMDTDVLSLQSLDGMHPSVIGMEDVYMLNNAVISFSKGHPFLSLASHLFATTFDPNWWGFNGPRLITRVWKRPHADRAQDDVMLAPSDEFYPLSWRDADKLFQPTRDHPELLKILTDRARLAHVWLHISQEALDKVKASMPPPDELLFERLMLQSCRMKPRFRRPSALREQNDVGKDLTLSSSWTMPAHLRRQVRTVDVSVHACAADADTRTSNVLLQWPSWAAQRAVSILSGGFLFRPEVGNRRTFFSWPRASVPWLAETHDSACGIPCSSIGTSQPLIIPLMDSESLTPAGSLENDGKSGQSVVFWVSTLTSDWTPRIVSTPTPPIDLHTLPDRNLGIRPVGLASEISQRLGDVWREGAPASGAAAAALVIGIEGGHLTVGLEAHELVRSDFPVADGRWHLCVIVVAASSLEGGGKVGAHMVSLYVDGLLHAHTTFSPPLTRVVLRGRQQQAAEGGREPGSANAPPPGNAEFRFSHALFGGVTASDYPLVFLDHLAVFSSELSPANIIAIHNLQKGISATGTCTPPLLAGSSLQQHSLTALELQSMRSDGVSTFRRPTVLVLILSDGRPASADYRQSARSTWLQSAWGLPIRYAFVVPVSAQRDLEQESRVHGDLAFVPASDDYRAMSRKTWEALLAALGASVRQVLKLTSHVDFVIKTDHDVFVRLNILYHELVQVWKDRAEGFPSETSADAPAPLRYWRGLAYNGMPPLRTLADKNADVSVPIMVFPPYTAGVLYVLSLDIIAALAKIPDPIFTLNEDQNLGIWVAQAVAAGLLPSITPVNDVRFQQWSVCFESQLAIHSSPPPLMQLLHANVLSGRPLCSEHPYGRCGMCFPCSESLSWFHCDEMGAHLPEFVSLDELSGVTASFLSFRTLSDVRGTANVLRRRALARGAPAGVGSIDEENNPDAGWAVRGGDSVRASGTRHGSPLSPSDQVDDEMDQSACPWVPEPWTFHGTGLVERAVSRPQKPPSLSWQMKCRSSACGGASAKLTLCGASTTFSRPAPDVGRCLSTPTTTTIPTEPDCSPLVTGSSSLYFGAIPPPSPAATQRSGGVLQWMRTIWGWPWTRCSAGAPPNVPTAEHSPSTPPSIPFHWMLLATMVDTRSVCSPAAPVGPQEAEEDGYTFAPRHGHFKHFCGFVIDIVYRNESISVRRSPFARGSSPYLHHEVFWVPDSDSVTSIVVTVVLNDAGLGTASFDDLLLLPLPGAEAPHLLQSSSGEKATASLRDLLRTDPRVGWGLSAHSIASSGPFAMPCVRSPLPGPIVALFFFLLLPLTTLLVVIIIVSRLPCACSKKCLASTPASASSRISDSAAPVSTLLAEAAASLRRAVIPGLGGGTSTNLKHA
jgi:enamine deaminase RidA (YjgF/YER057c/UK114 family)